MKKQRQKSETPKVPLNSRIITEDGPGTTIGMEFRRNTNGGPGCRQYRVRLDDGRIRHYSVIDVTKEA